MFTDIFFFKIKKNNYLLPRITCNNIKPTINFINDKN